MTHPQANRDCTRATGMLKSKPPANWVGMYHSSQPQTPTMIYMLIVNGHELEIQAILSVKAIQKACFCEAELHA